MLKKVVGFTVVTAIAVVCQAQQVHPVCRFLLEVSEGFRKVKAVENVNQSPRRKVIKYALSPDKKTVFIGSQPIADYGDWFLGSTPVFFDLERFQQLSLSNLRAFESRSMRREVLDPDGHYFYKGHEMAVNFKNSGSSHNTFKFSSQVQWEPVDFALQSEELKNVLGISAQTGITVIENGSKTFAAVNIEDSDVWLGYSRLNRRVMWRSAKLDRDSFGELMGRFSPDDKYFVFEEKVGRHRYLRSIQVRSGRLTPPSTYKTAGSPIGMQNPMIYFDFVSTEPLLLYSFYESSKRTVGLAELNLETGESEIIVRPTSQGLISGKYIPQTSGQKMILQKVDIKSDALNKPVRILYKLVDRSGSGGFTFSIRFDLSFLQESNEFNEFEGFILEVHPSGETFLFNVPGIGLIEWDLAEQRGHARIPQKGTNNPYIFVRYLDNGKIVTGNIAGELTIWERR